jgi:ribonuclease P protein component
MPLSAANLPKEERLHGKKDIERLLDSGKWGSAGCIRYCFILNNSDFSRLMVSVPKRLFKKAVKRNLLKRRMREAYRSGKPQQSIDILLQYTSAEVLPFAQIKQDINTALEKIAK